VFNRHAWIGRTPAHEEHACHLELPAFRHWWWWCFINSLIPSDFYYKQSFKCLPAYRASYTLGVVLLVGGEGELRTTFPLPFLYQPTLFPPLHPFPLSFWAISFWCSRINANVSAISTLPVMSSYLIGLLCRLGRPSNANRWHRLVSVMIQSMVWSVLASLPVQSVFVSWFQ